MLDIDPNFLQLLKDDVLTICLLIRRIGSFWITLALVSQSHENWHIYDQLKNLQTHQKWCDKNGEPNNAVIIMKTCASSSRTSASSYILDGAAVLWYVVWAGRLGQRKIVKCIPFFSFFSWVGNDSGQELCQTDISNVSPQEKESDSDY